MTATIYHNPQCGTSRTVLARLEEAGLQPTIVEYLKTPPDAETLASLLAAMGMRPRDLLRRKGTPYDALGLDDPKFTDDELIRLMVEHPILIERPVVVTETGTRLCRPADRVEEILPA